MLDHVSISHQSGLILYQKSFTPTFSQLAPAQSPINALFRDAMIEGKVTEEKGYEKDGFSVRWTVENGLGLVFVVVFPALLPLTYIQNFLSRMKQLYLSLFQPYLQSLVDSLSSISNAGQDALVELKDAMQREQWDKILLRCLRNCEGTTEKKQPKMASSLSKKAQLAAAQASASGASTPGASDVERSPMLTAEEIAKNVAALKGGSGSAKGKPKSGRVLRSGSASPSPSPSRKSSSNATAKLMRKWNDSAAVSTEDMAALDFSSPADENHVVDTEGLVSEDALGTLGKDGSYEVADWDFRRGPKGAENDGLPSEDEILARGAARMGISSKSTEEDEEVEAEGVWASVFSRIQGKKILSHEDLKPVLAEMEKHLMSKNVAKDIAEKLCEGVGSALAGKKLSGFSSIKSQVQAALSNSITRILTPKTSTDLLLDIRRKRSQPSSLVGDSKPDPFTITFVGVNGVGKSTNLSKVCFWLLQNKYRVLIAACDTFRSGAVEQLRVHVRNLGALGEQMGMGEDGKRIELYERGYGKDAAGIAKDAIAYAKENDFDVVLIDTAGRMQDNEPLMRALAKLVSVNNPDKLVFVGEALVGNEAVDQLSKFDRALKDFSGPQRKRGIDGIILTKFDTIDDKVGAALSMTYVTGQPILFVGCGQTYTDLRHLKVNHITQALLNS